MSQPIRIRTRLVDGTATVQILMPHPMETGLRRDSSGTLVAAHHITDVAVTLAGRLVFSAQLSIAVSRDPLIQFRVTGVRSGQPLRVVWNDSHGEARAEETVIA